jgi:hypothetical protein
MIDLGVKMKKICKKSMDVTFRHSRHFKCKFMAKWLSIKKTQKVPYFLSSICDVTQTLFKLYSSSHLYESCIHRRCFPKSTYYFKGKDISQSDLRKKNPLHNSKELLALFF